MLSSQARTAGLGGFIGFDYNALQLILVAKQVPVAYWDWVIEVVNKIAEIGKKYWGAKERE